MTVQLAVRHCATDFPLSTVSHPQASQSCFSKPSRDAVTTLFQSRASFLEASRVFGGAGGGCARNREVSARERRACANVNRGCADDTRVCAGAGPACARESSVGARDSRFGVNENWDKTKDSCNASQ